MVTSDTIASKASLTENSTRKSNNHHPIDGSGADGTLMNLVNIPVSPQAKRSFSGIGAGERQGTI